MVLDAKSMIFFKMKVITSIQIDLLQQKLCDGRGFLFFIWIPEF